MSTHKDQHYIPRSYLKAWCDPVTPSNQTPYIWLFNKDGKNVRKKSPDKIFSEKEMYTVTKADGERDLFLEHGLGQLENEFVNIRRKKFNNLKHLDVYEHVLVCVFIAAMHGRTKAQRDHFKSQWKRPLEMMESMMDWAKTATPEQKKQASAISSISSEGDGLNYEDVKALYEKPMQNMLPTLISIESPLLCKLDFAVLYTDDDIGFITSDRPCVWFDPEAYKRPPFYRGPALCYKTTEIRMPISPNQCIVLNQHGVSGYLKIKQSDVDEMNRIIRFSSKDNFVVRRNFKKDSWFDPGAEPEDSWEKMQKRSKATTP
jgi:hypothetical protein